MFFRLLMVVSISWCASGHVLAAGPVDTANNESEQKVLSTLKEAHEEVSSLLSSMEGKHPPTREEKLKKIEELEQKIKSLKSQGPK